MKRKQPYTCRFKICEKDILNCLFLVFPDCNKLPFISQSLHLCPSTFECQIPKRSPPPFSGTAKFFVNATDTLDGHLLAVEVNLLGSALMCIWPLVIDTGAAVSQDKILYCRLFQWINCLFGSTCLHEPSWEYSKMLRTKLLKRFKAKLYWYEMLITFYLPWKLELHALLYAHNFILTWKINQVSVLWEHSLSNSRTKILPTQSV